MVEGARNFPERTYETPRPINKKVEVPEATILIPDMTLPPHLKKKLLTANAYEQAATLLNQEAQDLRTQVEEEMDR